MTDKSTAEQDSPQLRMSLYIKTICSNAHHSVEHHPIWRIFLYDFTGKVEKSKIPEMAYGVV